MSTPNPSNDTQRELEQRALRNVRGLVEKMESLENADRRAQRRMMAWIVAAALAVVAVIGYAVWHTARKNAGPPVVIDATKLPPIRPGPAPAPR